MKYISLVHDKKKETFINYQINPIHDQIFVLINQLKRTAGMKTKHYSIIQYNKCISRGMQYFIQTVT